MGLSFITIMNGLAVTHLNATGLGVTIVLLLATLVLAVIVAGLTAAWKMFRKAGQPGWAALIPLYSGWVFARIAGRPGWWGLNQLLYLVPFVGWACSLVVSAIIAVDAAHRFGKSTKFGALALWILTPVGYMILAYGDAEYSVPDSLAPHRSFGAPDEE